MTCLEECLVCNRGQVPPGDYRNPSDEQVSEGSVISTLNGPTVWTCHVMGSASTDPLMRKDFASSQQDGRRELTIAVRPRPRFRVEFRGVSHLQG
jgi:hypothetical protein